jgi:predicted glycoside hydrolase/deacetylase ChbG (UPF0249 family)
LVKVFFDEYHSCVRRLLINADDLGITSQRSHGIFVAHEQGFVRSASLLPNFSESQKAARHARERELPTGLQINLCEGAPISRESDIETLLTTDGFFLDLKTLHRMLGEGDIAKEHIERELRSQFEWFLDHHGQPTHVCGHHHIHVHPVVAPVLAALFDRYGISFVRIPSEPVPPFGFEIEEAQSREIAAISKQAEAARSLFAAHGVQSTGHFRGLALQGNASNRNLRHILSRLPEGVTELMVHPGSQNPHGTPFEIDPQRVTEFNMVMNPELAAELAERKIELCSFADLY